MTRAAFGLALAACLALAVSQTSAFAQDTLSKRVTLDLKAMAPADAFKVIGDSVGMKVTVDAKVTAPIDILVRDVTARTALTTICESIGCRWTVANGAIVVAPADGSAPEAVFPSTKLWATTRQIGGTVERKRQLLEQIQAALKQPLPAGTTFEHAPLGLVCAKLSEALGLTITMTGGDPATTLTGDFSNKTLMSVLQSLGGAGSGATPLRIGITVKAAPGDTTAPSILIGFKVDPKKR
jgi:hypothetical protein